LEDLREPHRKSHRFPAAAIYFMADAIFLTFAKALANWIAEHWICVWIVFLPPYPTLALFALPLGYP
jgi:hypothetical protein